jgi:hypothetical protein
MKSTVHASLMLLCLISACRLPGEDNEIVTSFRIEPEAFDSFTSSASIRYTLARPAVTTLRVCVKGKEEPVIVLFESLRESKGSHQHVWLGDTDEGYFAKAGAYVGILEVEGQTYESVVRVYHR